MTPEKKETKDETSIISLIFCIDAILDYSKGKRTETRLGYFDDLRRPKSEWEKMEAAKFCMAKIY